MGSGDLNSVETVEVLSHMFRISKTHELLENSCLISLENDLTTRIPHW